MIVFSLCTKMDQRDSEIMRNAYGHIVFGRKMYTKEVIGNSHTSEHAEYCGKLIFLLSDPTGHGND